MKIFIYFILRAISIALSFVLFSVFGAMCAFIFLALSPTKDFDEACISNTKVADFLNSNQESISLSKEELDGGVFYILYNAATNASKEKHLSIAIPTPPKFETVGNDVLKVCIPVAIRMAGVDLRTVAAFDLTFDSKPKLKKMWVGKAAVLPEISWSVARRVLKNYEFSKELENYIDKVEDIKSIKISDSISFSR